MTGKYEYFAGINGVGGYVPLLEQLLAPMKKVYIIKGSAGSGKSTLMKRVAAAAEAGGREVVRIRCSSDPDSLDGVMVPSLGVAVADGTAPHTLDPVQYGIREQTVSLENSFDYDRLSFFAGRVERLLVAKSRYSRAASACIAACGELENVYRQFTEEALNGEKLNAFCRSFIHRNCRPGGGNVCVTPTDTFCRLGFITTGTFLDAQTVYVVRGHFGTSEALLSKLYSHGIAGGVDMRVIPCPIDSRRISGIYFTETDVLIRSDRFVPVDDGRTVRMTRFVDAAALGEYRARLNVVAKLEEKLFEEAAAMMQSAYETHKEIEKIYSQCVDFDVTDEITKKLIKTITAVK